MAHSLEVRPPLLDHRLVEFMLSVDPALLVDRATAPRQAAGSPTDGAAPAGRALGSAEVGLRSARASLAQAPSAVHAGRGGAPQGARRAATRRWAANFAAPGRLLVLDRWFTAFD